MKAFVQSKNLPFLRLRAIQAIGWLVVGSIFLLGCAGGKTHLKLGKTDEGEVVEAEGLAPMNDQDILATKRASLADAQKNAVEKVVGVFVSARTLVEKAVAIENNILSRTEGYVKKYEVLKEGPQEKGLYKTTIRALVALKDLEADLKELSLLSVPALQRPRVSIQFTEAIDKEPSDEKAAQSAFENKLIERGFTIVTGTSPTEADLLITGKVTSFPFQAEGLGGFVSYRARASLQVKKPGIKDVVLSMTKEASGMGGNGYLAGLKALETVAILVGEEASDKMAALGSKGKNVMVLVEGVPSFAVVEKIRKHLSSQPGVSDLTLRLYDEQMAQFELLLGSVEPAELAGRLESSQALPLKVIESTNQIIRVKLPQ